MREKMRKKIQKQKKEEKEGVCKNQIDCQRKEEDTKNEITKKFEGSQKNIEE